MSDFSTNASCTVLWNHQSESQVSGHFQGGAGACLPSWGQWGVSCVLWDVCYKPHSPCSFWGLSLGLSIHYGPLLQVSTEFPRDKHPLNGHVCGVLPLIASGEPLQSLQHFSSNHIQPPSFRPCGSWLINQACHLWWGPALMLGLQCRFLYWSELLPSPPSHNWLETQNCFCSSDSLLLITTSYGETLPKLGLLNDNGFSSWRPAQASVFLMAAASTFLGNVNIFT